MSPGSNSRTGTSSTAHQEDSQPNELVTRKNKQPPSVRTVVLPPPPHRSGVFNGRGRGGGGNTVTTTRTIEPVRGAYQKPMRSRNLSWRRTDHGGPTESSASNSRHLQMNSTPKPPLPAVGAGWPPRWDHAYRPSFLPSPATVKDSQTAMRSLGAPSSSHSNSHPISAFSSSPLETKPLVEDVKDYSVPTWNLSLKRSPTPEKKVATSPPRQAPIPPLKRRKINQDLNATRASTAKEQAPSQQIFHIVSSSSSLTAPTQSLGQIAIQEQSSALESLSTPRRLMKSGCKLYSPVPADCHRSHPKSAENRRAWLRREVNVLRGYGLKHIGSFIRDDGMSIDWESPVEVWSDTLLPEASNLASTIQQVYAMNDMTTEKYNLKQKRVQRSLKTTGGSPEIIDVDELFPSGGPERMNPSRSPLTGSRSPQLSLPSGSTNRMGTSSTHSNVTRGATSSQNVNMVPSEGRTGKTTSTSTVAMHKTSHITYDGTMVARESGGLAAFANAAPVPEQSELSEAETAGLKYLEAYIQHFDEDRMALANAYAPTAVFSYRIHDLLWPCSPTQSAAKQFAPFGSRQLIGCHPKRGRVEVMDALRSLGPHTFGSSGSASVEYDLLDLGETMGLLLICYGTVVDEIGKHQLSINQTFILRKVHDPKADGSTEGAWPFVAVSHQMVIRDLLQLPASGALE